MDAEPTAGVAGRPIREWHAVAAEEKAASVLRLLAGRRIDTVVDVGCGTGVVLQALDRQGFAGRYWACEPTPALHSEIPPIDRLVAAENTTFDQAFPGQGFDLAILSHVAEHLLTPDSHACLAPLCQRSRRPAKNRLRAYRERRPTRDQCLSLAQSNLAQPPRGNHRTARSAPRTPACGRLAGRFV